jgi:hypothetical protein
MVAKYLGMNLDAKLRWKGQIKKKHDELNIKIWKMYWLLGRNSEMSIHNKIILYSYKQVSSSGAAPLNLIFKWFNAPKTKYLSVLCKIWGFHGGDYEEWCLLSPWWRRRQVPPKRRFLQEPHGVTTQKTPFYLSVLLAHHDTLETVTFILISESRPLQISLILANFMKRNHKSISTSKSPDFSMWTISPKDKRKKPF